MKVRGRMIAVVDVNSDAVKLGYARHGLFSFSALLGNVLRSKNARVDRADQGFCIWSSGDKMVRSIIPAKTNHTGKTASVQRFVMSLNSLFG